MCRMMFAWSGCPEKQFKTFDEAWDYWIDELPIQKLNGDEGMIEEAEEFIEEETTRR